MINNHYPLITAIIYTRALNWLMFSVHKPEYL